MFRGIQAQRHDQRSGRELPHPREGAVKCGNKYVIAGTMRQWQIQIEPKACPLSCFVGVSRVEREVVRRVGMYGDRQEIGALIEYALGPVAVMHIDIHNGYALTAGVTDALRGYRSVVDVAETSGTVGVSMVTRRPAQRVRATLRQRRIRGPDCGPGAGAHRPPRA